MTAAFGAEPPFSAAQRASIVQTMREAFARDPSILRDAIAALQADEAARRLAAVHAVENDAQAPSVGNPLGDVTVVEFYDPRCPYCRTVRPALAALLAADHGVRLLYKDIPVLGPASELETRAILAARAQGGYARMQAALMADPAQPSLESIRSTATAQGLDAGRLLADMDRPEIAATIDANLKLARSLAVEGTPVFMIGDQVLPGAVDTAALTAAIAQARRKG